MLKMVKERSKWMSALNEQLKLKPTTERLLLFFIIVILFTHIMACLWYFLAKFDGFSPDTWVVRYEFQDENDSMLYLISFYYILTTITTVGYGDMTGYTVNER